jgi:hypothetical protein
MSDESDMDDDYVANSDNLRALAVLPERKLFGALSPFFLMDGRRKINVPWSAIVRDRPPISSTDKELTPQNVSCSDVCVLKTFDMGRVVYGWYAKRDDRLLERLPKRVVINILHECRSERPGSSLFAFNEASFSTPMLDFDVLAAIRFDRKHCVLISAMRKVKEQAAAACVAVRESAARQSQNANVPATRGSKRRRRTCVVCLEEEVVPHGKALPKKSSCKCSIHVCNECDERLRGLCPLCERTKVNADYECMCCGGFFKLDKSGFPCTTCGDRSLCRSCFDGFEECCDY